jgi:hypothetical protein
MKGWILLMMCLYWGNYFSFGQQVACNTGDTYKWQKIGVASVDFHENSDAIVVQSENRFSLVKFTVTDAPVEFIEIEVFYERDDMETVIEKTTVTVPGESGVINLNDGKWQLKKIVFNIKSEPGNRDKKGCVEIWGTMPKVND